MPRRPELQFSSPVRTDTLEIEHDIVLKLRPEAAAREMTVPKLVRSLLDVIANDKLTNAILDDGTE